MSEGAVLVTGAASGIGLATALALARAGHRTFAGVHREHEVEALTARGEPLLTPFVLDVTDAASVAAAVETIRAATGDAGLAGLVNNAGIGTAAPVELVDLGSVRTMFEVNVFGLVAVTQAMLPLLRAARGRVVNLGSVGSEITMPFAGALCASKHAVAALNHAMRMELRPWGIEVVLVEPGSINTAAVEHLKADADRFVDAMTPTGRALYGSAYRTAMDKAVERESKGSPPEAVAEVIVRALTTDRPRTRYAAGAHARLLLTLARTVPDRLLDRLRLKILGGAATRTAPAGDDAAARSAAA
jgi:NAD(P)-dependent dehydrogenase (short-subunit alcohol dehydrogenase family)